MRSRDVHFAGPGGTVHTGELVEPTRGGSHAAILFVHWLGNPVTTNHTEFEADALSLATHGISSFLIDAMWAQPGWFKQMGRDAGTDYQRTVTQVVALRCALDVLMLQRDVDASRIAYVGHDFGAMLGAILAGVDQRPKWYVMMAGTSSLPEWYLLGNHLSNTTDYIQTMAPLDILTYLRKSKARGILFQFSESDPYIPLSNALAFAMASRPPRTISFYDSTHSMINPEATADRLAWLLSRLQL